MQNFLDENGLGHHYEKLSSHAITLDILYALSEIDLHELGIEEEESIKILKALGIDVGTNSIAILQKQIQDIELTFSINSLHLLKNTYLKLLEKLEEKSISGILSINLTRQIALLNFCIATCLKHEDLLYENIDDEKPFGVKEMFNIARSCLKDTITHGISAAFDEKSQLEKDSEKYLFKALSIIINLYESNRSTVFVKDLRKFINLNSTDYNFLLLISSEQSFRDIYYKAKKIIDKNEFLFIDMDDKFSLNKLSSESELIDEDSIPLDNKINKVINFITKIYKPNINTTNYIFIFQIVVFILSIFGFSYFDSHLVKAFFLSSIVSSIIYVFLTQFSSFNPWFSSSFTSICPHMGLTLASVYYLINDPSLTATIITVTIGCLSIYLMLRKGWSLIKETYILFTLWKDFKLGKARKGQPAIVLLLSSGGIVYNKVQKQSSKINQMISQSYKKGSLAFICPSSVNNKLWINYLIKNADAIITVDHSNLFSFISNSLNSTSLNVKCKQEIAHSDSALANPLLLKAKGKIITVQLDTGEELPFYSDIDSHKVGLSLGSGVILSAEITKSLANSTAPMSWSDEQLNDKAYALADQLRFSGCKPVAQAYLRFRIANSDVERFLALLDSVEAIIRLSVILLISQRWAHDCKDAHAFAKTLERPTLGKWIGILQELIKTPISTLDKKLAESWSEPLSGIHKNLLSEAKGSGLIWHSKVPRSHLGWLDWFVWLRNKTRGHGFVDETIADPLWHSLHESFLDLGGRFSFLIFDGKFHTSNVDVAGGWKRFSKVQKDNEKYTITDFETYFFNSNQGATPSLKLFPLMLGDSENYFLYNSFNRNSIEYIDYMTGKLITVSVDKNNDIYSLWLDR